MIDLGDVRAFLAVIDAGGLGRAGGRLDMSKSMLSRRLARLEERLGAPLLARTTRGMSLTEAGQEFRPHAERMVAEMQAGLDAVTRAGEASGRLRIAAPMALGETHIAPLLARLALDHPRLEIQASYSDSRVDIVAEGFDAAIRLGELNDSTLVARRIASVRGAVVASPDYLARMGEPRTPAELEQHVALRRDDRPWRFLENGRTVSIRPQGRFLADSGAALLAAAVAGLGVAMLPAFLAGPALERGELVHLLPDHPVPTAGMYLLRPPPASYQPNKIKVLADALIARFDPGYVWDGCPSETGMMDRERFLANG